MDLKGLKKRALENVAINRRASLLFFVVFIAILGLVYSFVSFVAHSGAFRSGYKEPIKKVKKKSMTPIEYKESLIIGLENKLNKTEKKVNNFSSIISKQIKDSFEKQNQLIDSKLKNEAIRVNTANLRTQALLKKVNERVDAIEEKTKQLNKFVSQLSEKVNNNSNSIQNVKKTKINYSNLLPPPKNKVMKKKNNLLLPPPIIQKDEGNASKKAAELLPIKSFSFDMEDNKGVDKIIKAQVKKKENKQKKKLNDTVDMLTSFTSAYMITGAYAPVFGTSALGSVPVILESEGDVMLPNEYRGDIDKCFLIGGAVGDPSNDRVLIKIKQVQCVFNDRKRQIVGNVNGWVYDKTGAAGVAGKFISKTGRYIWRMIAAGVLQGLGQAALNQTAPTGNTYNYNGTSTTASSALAQGTASGINSAFQKLADFYLKLAEKTVPALEAKGGQKVTVVFKGNSTLQIKKFNAADLPFLDKKY